MKKAIFGLSVFVMMCCLSSCGGKNVNTSMANDSVIVDSVVVDTLAVDSTVIVVDSIAKQ